MKNQVLQNTLTRLVMLANVSLCLIAPSAEVRAATLVVTNTDDNGPGTLREALAIAADGDVIKCPLGSVVLTSGPLQVTKSVSITGVSPYESDIYGTSRLLEISPGLTVDISGLSFAGGYVIADSGGAIRNDHSFLTLSNCGLYAGYADYDAGAIHNDGRFSGNARLVLRDCVVQGNNSASGAGAIKNDGTDGGSASMSLINCLFADNHALGFLGGAIWNDGFNGGNANLEITGCTFNNNSAYNSLGGAIANDGYSGSVSLKITNTTFLDNASQSGGAISNSGENHGNALLTLNSCSLINNVAGSGGGGVWNNAINGTAQMEVIASTLAGNIAYNFYGGGIWNDGFDHGHAVLTVVNSTISGNFSFFSRGGAIANDGYAGSARAQLLNSTLSGNADSEGHSIFNEGGGGGEAILEIGHTILHLEPFWGITLFNNFGTVSSLGYNLASGDAAGFLNAATDRLNTDPLLGPLQDNGGPTMTHALLPGSPSIDSGDPTFTAPPIFDQRGAYNLRVSNQRLDIGAYEFQFNTIPDQITKLILKVDGLSSASADLKAALKDKLQAAQANYAAGHTRPICGVLNAFIKQVKAQTGKQITEAEAAELISEAQSILSELGC